MIKSNLYLYELKEVRLVILQRWDGVVVHSSCVSQTGVVSFSGIPAHACQGESFVTSSTGHKFCGAWSSTMSTTSLICKFLSGCIHVCLRWRDGRYSSIQRFQEICKVLHLPCKLVCVIDTLMGCPSNVLPYLGCGVCYRGWCSTSVP